MFKAELTENLRRYIVGVLAHHQMTDEWAATWNQAAYNAIRTNYKRMTNEQLLAAVQERGLTIPTLHT